MAIYAEKSMFFDRVEPNLIDYRVIFKKNTALLKPLRSSFFKFFSNKNKNIFLTFSPFFLVENTCE